MTDEQIKQKAKAYADNAVTVPAYTRAYDSFIAGAHSRDEYIGKLEDRIKVLDMNLVEQQLENKQLRNPWISVEDRLPEKGDIVLTNIVHIIDGAGEHKEDSMFSLQRYEGRWITDRMEQHRMGAFLFDTISRVTHWMPIPELKKGEKAHAGELCS